MAKKSFEERKKIIYDLVRDALYVPMKEKELAIFLQVEPEDRPQLKQALEELLKEHAIEITKRGKYKAPENPILEGRFIANEKGFGFIEVEGQEEDYYVPEEYVLATAEYGYEFVAAVRKGNVYGFQFHPEKSGAVGLNILRAFNEI